MANHAPSSSGSAQFAGARVRTVSARESYLLAARNDRRQRALSSVYPLLRPPSLTPPGPRPPIPRRLTPSSQACAAETN